MIDRTFVGASALAAIGLTSLPALSLQAKPTPAEVIFREGREAAAKGDMTTACAKFDASVRLARAPGPLMNLAECEEKAGKLLSAAKLWKEAVEKLEASDERRAFATKRGAELEKRLPRLTVRVTPETRDVQLEIDGSPVPPAQAREPQPVDPGAHKVVVKAGDRSEVAEVTLGEGERREVAVSLGPEKAAGPAPIPPPEEPSGAMRIAGFVSLGVGAAGLAVFGVTAALIESQRGTVKDQCNEAKICSAAGVEAAQSARSMLPINAVGFAVGIVGVGAGVTLIILSPSAPGSGTSAALRVRGAPGAVSASLAGTF